jgi:hypothetical protein
MLEQGSKTDKAYCDDHYDEAGKTEFVLLRQFTFTHGVERLVSATIWRKPLFKEILKISEFFRFISKKSKKNGKSSIK